MKEFWNTIQFAFAAIGGWLGWFLGGCDGLLIALILFAVTDYITGFMCAVADKKLMENKHYLGDEFYPAIIDRETYDKAAEERLRRAGKLGRLNRKKTAKPAAIPTRFHFTEAETEYEDPRLQAEYLYSLIESEVS